MWVRLWVIVAGIRGVLQRGNRGFCMEKQSPRYHAELTESGLILSLESNSLTIKGPKWPTKTMYISNRWLTGNYGAPKSLILTHPQLTPFIFPKDHCWLATPNKIWLEVPNPSTAKACEKRSCWSNLQSAFHCVPVSRQNAWSVGTWNQNAEARTNTWITFPNIDL